MVYEEEIRRGIAWLEAEYPGNIERIVIDDLDLASFERCPIGQIFGRQASKEMSCFDEHWSTEHGFQPSGPCTQEDFHELTEDWKTILRARKSVPESR